MKVPPQIRACGLALAVACAAGPAAADHPAGPQIDGDALIACIEAADGAGGGRAACAGAAAEPCFERAGHITAWLACAGAERAVWVAMVADWSALIAAELDGEARAAFLVGVERWQVSGDGMCRGRWHPPRNMGAVEVAHCRLQRWAGRVDALIARYRALAPAD